MWTFCRVINPQPTSDVKSSECYAGRVGIPLGQLPRCLNSELKLSPTWRIENVSPSCSSGGSFSAAEEPCPPQQCAPAAVPAAKPGSPVPAAQTTGGTLPAAAPALCARAESAFLCSRRLLCLVWASWAFIFSVAA